MKRFLAMGIAVLFLFMGMSPWVSAEEMKVGSVDLARTFDAFQKTKSAEKALEDEAMKKKDERDKRIEEIKKLKGELDLLNEKGKTEKQALIDQKIKDLQQFERDAQNNLRREKERTIQEILKEIDDVVQAYARDHGYTILLNDRALLYRSEGMDVTNDIIAILNKGAAASSQGQGKEKKR